jgi:hypothetical protein
MSGDELPHAAANNATTTMIARITTNPVPGRLWANIN